MLLAALLLIGLSSGPISAEFQCPVAFAEYPDPENCIKYYECIAGVAYRETCPKDETDGVQLEFFRAGLCDRPENVFCHERPICDENDENCSFEVSTETPAAYRCQAPNGWFPDLHDCQKFYHCVSDVPEHLDCFTFTGPDTYWNQEAIACDFLDNVECGDRPINP